MPSPLFVYGATHRNAPLSVREKLALSGDQIGFVYEKIRAHPHLREFALLSTCNRMEIYAVAEKSPEFSRHILRDLMGANLGVDPSLIHSYLIYQNGREAVQHLIEVASGVDSLVVGEAEILGQVKSAYAEARSHDTIGPVLNRLFQKTFQSAKWVRTHTEIGRGQVSVGTVAVELAQHVFGPLDQCRVLVIGAGEIAEKTLAALQSRGARKITVTNRTYAKACEAAQLFRGQALPFENLESALRETDIVIGSTASPQHLLDYRKLAPILNQRPMQPLFLIDLAVPRDFSADCEDLENVYLYNIDNLADLAEQNRQAREKELTYCRSILAQRSEQLWNKLSRHLT